MANSYTDSNGVYRNLLGITDAERLRRVEYGITLRKSNKILGGEALPDLRGYGWARQQAIHQYLFQDVYEWAGKPRTVPSSKHMGNGLVSVFDKPDTFERSWQALEQKTDAFVKARGLNFAQKCEALADIFIEANRIHPFPEGNGRSLQVFMEQLAKEQGVALHYDKIPRNEWNLASGVSGRYGELLEQDGKKYLDTYPPNPRPIKEIFAKMTSPTLEYIKSHEGIEKYIQKLQAKPLAGGLPAVIEQADPKSTQPYTGKIVALTQHHALQQVGANKFILHEHKNAAQELNKGYQATIAYTRQKSLAPGKTKNKGLQR